MALSTNFDYLTTIFNKDDQIRVVANTPEQIHIATGSVWEPRMAGSLRNTLLGNGGGLGNFAANMAFFETNLDIVVQSLTFQAWQSSSPIEFNMTLLFDAENDAFNDVVLPMSKLQEMTLPYNLAANPDIMMPPGPAPLFPDRSRVSIRIGRFLYIHSIVLKSVNNTFDTRYDANGQPISGQSEITFATINTPSRADVTSFYILRNHGINGSYGTRMGSSSLTPGAR